MKIYLLIAFSLIMGCSNKLVPNETINASNSSLYQIQCIIEVTSKSESDGVNEALRKAFEKLFFIGYPSTIASSPLITEDVKIDKNRFLNEFIVGKKYEPFITSINNNFSKLKNKSSFKYSVRSTFTIDIESLRRYLSTTGSTRKFGF